MSPGSIAPARSVSSVELLFDLVFVFVVSQATSAVGADHSWTGLARIVVTLTLVWWMYDGFAWSTNTAAPTTLPLRLGLILAMVCFLMAALALPDAFGSAGLMFGLAYLGVVLLHLWMFLARGYVSGAWRVAWYNIAAGACLVAAGFVTGPLDWVLFLVPVALFALSAVNATDQPTSVGASHFVERHGLFMLIAFGESIVAVGSESVTAGGATASPGVHALVSVVLAVGLVAALWWCYFSRDDETVAQSLDALGTRRRTIIGLTAFGLCHLAMLFGLICLAAGLKVILAEPFEHADAASVWLLCAGLATFLLAEAEFRRELHLQVSPWRLAAAALVLASALVVTGVGAVHAAVALVVVLVALVLEAVPGRRH